MNCYACGQRVSPETSFQDISAAEEVSSILRTTERLGDLILSFNATRVKLLQRLNQLRASTRVCPPEILSTIFQHASSPTDFTALKFLEEDEDGVSESHRQITLSAVSWQWRQVIFATPQLWTNAVINVTRKSVERKAQLLQLYLNNVGIMTISLALHIFPGYGRLISKSELDPVINSIWSGAQKFKLLSLCSIPKSFISFLPADFTQLEDLRLKWTWDDLSGLHTTQISSFPRLRQLYLWGAPIHIPSHPLCQSLTILRFFDVPLHISIQMLILCPNLVEYACHQTSIDIAGTIPQISEPITFPHMKFFYSPCSADALFSSILHKFKFPVLEALGLELGADKDGLEELVSFIVRLPTSWSILEINGYGYSREILETIFRSLPRQVRSLHLPEIDCWNLGYILSTLNGFDRNNNPHMVGLQKIYIDSRCHSLQTMEDIEPSSPSNPQLFLNMVSARKDHLRDGQFYLEIKSLNEIHWEEVREQLDQMAVDGFKLRITLAGESKESLLNRPRMGN